MRRGPIPYSAEELAWLEANYKMVISDYHREFVARFDRQDVELVHLNQLRKRKGWKVGRDGSRYRGRLRSYSEAEMAWLEENRLLPISEYHARFNQQFDRTVTAKALHQLRKRYGWKTGRTGQFVKGQEPLNKGKTCPPGTGGRHPNARRTQFRKGNRTGKANENYQPIGTERISKDGYVERKVHDGLPMQSRWQLVQRIEWEAVNGSIPEDHCLKCLDGDKLNTSPDNWALIPRAVLPLLSGRHGMGFETAEPEVKPTMMTIARLKHAARKAKANQKDQAHG